MSKYNPKDWPVGTRIIYSFGWIRRAEGVILEWADVSGTHVKIKDGKRSRWFDADEIAFNAALDTEGDE